MPRSRWSVEELQVVIAGLKERLDQRRFCHFLGLSPRTRSYYRSFEGGEPGRRGYDRIGGKPSTRRRGRTRIAELAREHELYGYRNEWALTCLEGEV